MGNHASDIGECDAAAVWNGHELIEGCGSGTTINRVRYEGSVQAINPTTGRPTWRTGLPGYVDGSPSEDGGGVVAAPVFFSTTGANGVYLLSARTGAILKFIPTTAATGVFAQPVFDGNDLLIAGSSLPLTAYAVTRPGQATPIRISPNIVQPGTTVELSITGTGGFSTPLTAIVSGSLVRVESVQVISPTSVMVKVQVSRGAEAGARDVAVIKPTLVAYTCASCLRVG
jgi:hypothetical protein